MSARLRVAVDVCLCVDVNARARTALTSQNSILYNNNIIIGGGDGRGLLTPHVLAHLKLSCTSERQQ